MESLSSGVKASFDHLKFNMRFRQDPPDRRTPICIRKPNGSFIKRINVACKYIPALGLDSKKRILNYGCMPSRCVALQASKGVKNPSVSERVTHNDN